MGKLPALLPPFRKGLSVNTATSQRGAICEFCRLNKALIETHDLIIEKWGQN
jgi:hypothetical protein